LFTNNIKPVEDYITSIRKPSVEASNDFRDNSIEIVFIDAAHEYEPVKEDINAWLPKVRNGGLIAGHDYLLPSVKKAVDEIFGNRVMFRDAMENCWIVQKQ
jgi:predicted O-methyltransferase YrrM